MNFYPQYSEPLQPGYHQLGADDYVLTIRQQPRDGLVAQEGKEKARKPIDPPPFIELTVREGADPRSGFLVDPYLFVCASLLPSDATTNDPALEIDKALCGSIVSSLHKLKDVDNKEGGFFVFGDLSAKRTGDYKLVFSLFELQKASHEVVFLRSVLSESFTVHPQKEWGGAAESTALSRAFQEQGVKLRLRKEQRPVGSASGRKRSFPFGGGTSRGSTVSSKQRQSQGSAQPTPLLYDSSPAVGDASFSTEFGRQQRTDEPSSQYASAYGVAQTSGGPPDSAVSTTFPAGSQLYQHASSLTQSPVAQMRTGSQGRWSAQQGRPQTQPHPGYYSPTAMASSQALASPGHPPGSAGLMSHYDRSSIYGGQHPQQMGLAQGLAIQVHGTPPNPSSPFQQPHSATSYPSMDPLSGMGGYHGQHSAYRDDSAYGGGQLTPSLHSMHPQSHYADPSSGQPHPQSQQSYADMPYVQSQFDPQGRSSEYQMPPSTRGWSSGQ